MNCSGVALAADSAVTVGSQKIYNSAMKLFALSKIAPVAIMIFGNAALSNVPWEIVIKEYRRSLAATTFATLDEYAKNFVKFIEDSEVLFNKAGDEMWLRSRCYELAEHLASQCMKEVNTALQGSSHAGLSQSEIEDIFVAFLKSTEKNLKEWNSLNPSKEVQRRLAPVVDEAVELLGPHVFGEVFPKVRVLLRRILKDALKRDMFPPESSGVVLAGYGESEIYPTVLTLEFDGAVRGYVRYKVKDDRCQSISPGTVPASIIPFAQGEMVATFMEGMNPSIRDFVETSLHRLFDALPAALMQGLNVEGANVERSLAELGKELRQGFMKGMDDHRRDEHVNPVMGMVMALPKDELAAMAESLVNLTAFKRRVTGDLETVGGPIDVCVISKGDGLVWVKRKHYFPPELNVMFHKNYLRELGE